MKARYQQGKDQISSKSICLGSRWAWKLKLTQASGEKFSVGKKREWGLRATRLERGSFYTAGRWQTPSTSIPKSPSTTNCIASDLHRRPNLYNQNRWNQNSNPSTSRKDRKERATVRSELLFPNSSPELAETRATRADWGKSAGARHTDSGSWYLPSLHASTLPRRRRLPLLYLGHLIRCQFPDRFREKGRKLAAR